MVRKEIDPQLGGSPWVSRGLFVVVFCFSAVGVLCGMGGFGLVGWEVVEVAVGSGGVLSVRPAQGGGLGVVDGSPWSLVGASGLLGLVEGVDCFGEGVVV